MFNPVIIFAILIQSAVAKSSRIAGAVIGYVITTGILLWGISLYGQGSRIAFFGIPLTESIFFIACLIWYGFDTKEFAVAWKQEALEADNPLVAIQNWAKDINTERTSPKRACPYCQKKINIKSYGCEHCGRDLPDDWTSQ